MAKAELKFTLSISTAQGHAMVGGRVSPLKWGLRDPGEVPTHVPVPHLTCDIQVPGST